MILIDEDNLTNLAVIELVRSQCMHLPKPTDDYHEEIMIWCRENAGQQIADIPFSYWGSESYLSIKNKWGIHYRDDFIIYWIENMKARTEFALRWL
jgi:hypothetical protein